MGSFQYSFTAILGYWLHGVYQLIRHVAPFIQPLPEGDWPPPLWFLYWSHGDWVNNRDREGRPNGTFIDLYIKMAQLGIRDWVGGKAEDARDQAVAWVRAFTGDPPWPFSTLAAWVQAFEGRVGTGTLSWASSYLHGIQNLWSWIPADIRNGWSSWVAIWEGIKSDVRAWAMLRFDAAVGWASEAVAWVRSTGAALYSWYLSVYLWIGQFMADPRETITRYLGAPWAGLETFYWDCLAYYYNLWSLYAGRLSEFLADPMEFVLSRLADAISARW